MNKSTCNYKWFLIESWILQSLNLECLLIDRVGLHLLSPIAAKNTRHILSTFLHFQSRAKISGRVSTHQCSAWLWYLSCYKQVTGQMCGGGLHRPTGWQSGGRCSFQTFTVWYPWYVTSHTYQVTRVQCVTSLVTHVSGIPGM